MTEPRRLIESDVTEAERELLASWRSEQPSRRAREAALLLVARGAGAPGPASAPTAAGPAIPPTGAEVAGLARAEVLAKLMIAIGAIAGVVAVAALAMREPAPAPHQPSGANLLQPAPSSPSPSATPPEGLPPPASQAAPTEESARAGEGDRTDTKLLPSKVAAPVASIRPRAPSVAPAREGHEVAAEAPTGSGASPAMGNGSSLMAEVASLDRARAALSAGDAAGALSSIDAHDAAFPSSALSQEAAVVRIEALVKLGRRPDAAELARAFLRAHPTSPHAARVRDLANL